MVDVRCVKIRLREDSIARVRAWAAELNVRREEALVTLQNEGVSLECYFLDQTNTGDYLIALMRGDDLDRAREIAALSSHPIDSYQEAFKKATWVSHRLLDPLLCLDRIEER